MSFLDSLKQNALAVLHATANALHAQLANTLSQAGHPVTEADHVDTLVQTAVSASTGAAGAPAASTTAPNYADAALATFNQSMTAALIQFAQQHLPAKFQGVAGDAIDAVSAMASGADIAKTALGVAETAVGALVPGAAPFVAVIAPIADALAAGDTASAVAQAAPVVQGGLDAAVTAAEAEADKALPGAGGIVSAAVAAIEGVFGAKADKAPTSNQSGV